MNAQKLSDALNHLDDDLIGQATPATRPRRLRRWAAAAAACLVLVAVGAAVLPRLSAPSVTPIVQQAPADAPNGIRKFFNYDGHRYALLEGGATYALTPDQLGEELGVLTGDIQAEPEIAGEDLATTFGEGGTLYRMTNYDPAFRLALQVEDSWYLCENAGRTDGEDVDMALYFETAGFAGSVTGTIIRDHAGSETLAQLDEAQSQELVTLLAAVTPAVLKDEDYQRIGTAQREGRSYQAAFQLADGTEYKFYLIPSPSIAMLGDNRYQLPEDFADAMGSVFENLPVRTPPAMGMPMG